MEESFESRPLIAKARMRELNARRNAPGTRRLIAQVLAYLGSGAWLVMATETWQIVVALLANGAVQFGFFGMLHEACHRTIFRSRGANDFAGWVAALAQPMSPALMRAFHYEHHRHTHELPYDPELAGMKSMAAWPRHVVWLVTVTGVPVLIARSGWALFAALTPARLAGGAWAKVLPFVRPEQRARVAWEARVLVAIHAGIICTAIFVWPPLWRIYWGMVAGHMFLSWYISCEHRGLPEGADVPVLAKTRSLIVPAPVRWLLWNMPFHAEHHGWPSVPFFNLPALHQEVKAHLVHRVRPSMVHLRRGRPSAALEGAKAS